MSAEERADALIARAKRDAENAVSRVAHERERWLDSGDGALRKGQGLVERAICLRRIEQLAGGERQLVEDALSRVFRNAGHVHPVEGSLDVQTFRRCGT
jgi:hypothetical protein